jgi:UDP-N-acetylglucosamine acyltransferase
MPKESTIHSSAVIEDGAQLGAGVEVGPFCHISKGAVLGDGVRLHGHVTIMGATTLGSGCEVFPGAVLGAPPQNLKHKGGPTTLEIGRDCIIREGASFHCGTDTSRARTTVGDGGYFMAYSHVAHDCNVGNNVTMANYAGLGGHADIGDNVIISGYAAVHQFVRVGHHAFLGGYAAVVGDVIPYGMAVGDRARLRGFNVIGLKRSGMARNELTTLRQAYRLLFSRERPMAENLAAVSEQFAGSPAVMDIVGFLAGRKRRNLTVPPLGREAEDDVDDGE